MKEIIKYLLMNLVKQQGKLKDKEGKIVLIHLAFLRRLNEIGKLCELVRHSTCFIRLIDLTGPEKAV